MVVRVQFYSINFSLNMLQPQPYTIQPSTSYISNMDEKSILKDTCPLNFHSTLTIYSNIEKISTKLIYIYTRT